MVQHEVQPQLCHQRTDGKEWMLGRNKQNILSINLKLTLQGGDRYSPIDMEATMKHPDKEVQYDERKAFSKHQTGPGHVPEPPGW